MNNKEFFKRFQQASQKELNRTLTHKECVIYNSRFRTISSLNSYEFFGEIAETKSTLKFKDRNGSIYTFKKIAFGRYQVSCTYKNYLNISYKYMFNSFIGNAHKFRNIPTYYSSPLDLANKITKLSFNKYHFLFDNPNKPILLELFNNGPLVSKQQLLISIYYKVITLKDGRKLYKIKLIPLT